MSESFATTTSAADWCEWTASNVAVEGDGVTVATTTDRDRDRIASGAVAVADGGEDSLTVVDDGGVVRVDPEASRRERLCSDGPWRAPVAACSRGDRVVIADAADGSVTVVSPRRRRPRRVETDATDPVGVAVAAGRVLVLDADGRVLATRGGSRTDTVIDRVDGAARDPAAADDAVRGSAAPDESVRGSTAADGTACDIAAAAGRLFVLCDRGESGAVRCYDADTGAFEDSLALPASLTPTAIAAGSSGPLVAGTVDDGDTLLGEPRADGFEPRCRVEGPCHALATSEPGVLYGVFGASRHVERVVERERPAVHPERDERVGTASHRYDAGSDGTAWHRLRVDASRRSPSTRVRVHYRATDGEVSATAGAADGDDGSGWTTIDVRGAGEHRLRDARGRYLHVRLELVGTAESAPRVDSVRAFCDRDSIGQYLPDLYDEGAGTALDGFLMAFETFFDGIEDDIDALTGYLDPEAAPTEALSWLESWFAVEGTESWPESARRELLTRAPELYRKRGTEAGVRELIHLYRRHAEPGASSSAGRGRDAAGTAEDRPFFFGTAAFERTEDAPGPDELSGVLPGGADVVCYCRPFETAADREAIEAVVERETPAHVRTAVAPLERSCSLDGATFLGVNSRLTRRAFELGTARLDGSSALESTTRTESDRRTTPLTDHNR